MDERVKFIGRFLSGEKIAPLCREFGISRKTGHKIVDRYKDGACGAFRPFTPSLSSCQPMAVPGRTFDISFKAGISRLGRTKAS